MLPVVLLLLSAACVRRAPAQSAPSNDYSTSAIVEAVSYLLATLRSAENLPEGGVRFEPRPLVVRPSAIPSAPGGEANEESVSVVEGRWAEPRPKDRLNALLRRLGAEAGNYDEAVRCAGTLPSSCSLPGAVAIFAASEPVGDATRTRVVVAARWQSGSRKQPFYEGTFLVTLMREGRGSGLWRVRGMHALSIT